MTSETEGSREGEAGLSWSLTLPERRAASLGARRTRGLLSIHSAQGEEAIPLPASAARSLERSLADRSTPPSSRAELLYVLSQVEGACARHRVESLLERRDYSSHEMEGKLRDDGYPGRLSSELVARYVAGGLIDDRRYADVFARSKVSAGWGRRRIELELGRRGIQVDELPGWPYDYLNPEDEDARAFDLASRRSFRGRDPYAQCVRFLMGRGFSGSVAVAVARRVRDGDEEGL